MIKPPATSMEAESIEDQCEIYSHPAGDHGGNSASPLLPPSTRCIMISELQWKIFDLIAPPNVPVSTADRLLESELNPWEISSTHNWAREIVSMRRSLLALALTWQVIHSTCIGPFDEKKLEFQRPMTSDDWFIFRKYNHRVRSLLNQCHDSSMRKQMICGTEIWRALSCPPFSLPLLPNLTSLTWTETTNETFQYIQLFVTPKLTTLCIHAHGFRLSPTFGPSESSILSSIPKWCPSVSDFDFGTSTELDPDIQPTELADTSTVLQSWSHLTSVRTGTLSEAAILHLSQLPSLRVLKFQLPSTLVSADTQSLLQRPVFCALQELDIACKNMEILEAFLEKLAVTPTVLSFTITHGVDSARALPALISRISNGCAHSSLQQVRLSIADEPAVDNASIGAAAFQPLFAFRNLRKLDFDADRYCIVRMNDAVLLQMAKAWPLLEEYTNSSHQVAPNAFVSLLYHCPCLVSVAVTLDWRPIDHHAIPPDLPYHGFSHKALSQAFFGGSRISHPIRIAAFISAIAPNIESIEAWNLDFHEYYDAFRENSPAWRFVQDSIESLPLVREQGRRMMWRMMNRG
ncbi:hypothetical protein DFH29DRAFT_923403 [Suillus ampliporus]|nr:hypothetical protein DFH29DRAFT_923403 [Suillus ampliporus]